MGQKQPNMKVIISSLYEGNKTLNLFNDMAHNPKCSVCLHPQEFRHLNEVKLTFY